MEEHLLGPSRRYVLSGGSPLVPRTEICVLDTSRSQDLLYDLFDVVAVVDRPDHDPNREVVDHRRTPT